MTLELASFPIREEQVSEAGNVPHDNPPEPFSTSKTSNWVARVGGLPSYIQHVAHAMVEKGRPVSKAIEMAVGIVRNWAEGKGNVHPAIKAAAAKAMAEWEAKRAASHASSAAKKGASVTEGQRLLTAFIGECKDALSAITLNAGSDPVQEVIAGGLAFMLLESEGADDGPAALMEVDLSEAGREKMAKAKTARPDGSFPIPSVEFLKKAIKAFGRAGNKDAVKAWIKKRARALGATKLLPSNWAMAEAESELYLMAEELTVAIAAFEPLLSEKLSEAYNPPNWVIPKQAQQPGFKPLNPPKAKSSSSGSSGYDPNKHPRDQMGKWLAKGHNGAAVKGVQQRLGIKTTGTFNDQTKTRVERYQRNHGLQVDGIVGSQTAASLLGKSPHAPGVLPMGMRKQLQGLVKLHAELVEEAPAGLTDSQKAVYAKLRLKGMDEKAALSFARHDKSKKTQEALSEQVSHVAHIKRDNGVKAANHSSIRSAIFDLADSAKPTHTVKLPNGTEVKNAAASRPGYGNYGRAFTVSNGKEMLQAMGVEEAADMAKELDSRRMRSPSGTGMMPGMSAVSAT